MEKYQYNSIKSIYGKGTLDNLLTISDAAIKNFYEYTHRINSNGIEVPNKVCTINSYHGFSSYTTYLNTYTYFTYEDNINSIDPQNLKKIFDSYPVISYAKYNNLYKILKAKDIDWDNAYLKYLGIQKKYNEPIAYYYVNTETGDIYNETTYYCYDYVFDKYLCNNAYTINTTDELINIIDYLFTRYNSLRFEIKNVLDQRQAKQNKQ